MCKTWELDLDLDPDLDRHQNEKSDPDRIGINTMPIHKTGY
jgi:hypothetical protein